MGVQKGITAKTFPKQGDLVGKRVQVCFNYDTSEQIGGTVVRDDIEEPFVSIFKLDDGRHILSRECQYTY